MKKSASLPAIGNLKALPPTEFVKVSIDLNGGRATHLSNQPKWSFGKAKNLKYTDLQARAKKHVPGPNAYAKQTKWAGKKSGSRAIDYSTKRNTFIEQIMRKEKDMPAPNHYLRNVKARAPPGAFIPKGENINFLSEAEYLGSTNPGVAYSPDLNKFKYSSSSQWQMGPGFATSRLQRPHKRKQSDAPSPNSYNTLDAWRSTKGLVKTPSFSSVSRPSAAKNTVIH